MDELPLHYEALSVPEDAPLDTIRSAWREIARTSHPDRAGSDLEARLRFQRASDAWSVLRDEATRAAYDAQLVYARTPRCARCGQPCEVSGLYCSLCVLATLKPPPPPKPKSKPKARSTPPRAPSASPSPPPPPPPPEPPVDPFRGESAAHRARREAEEQRIYDRTRVFDDINRLHAPSSDNLLEALLADAALRAEPPKRTRAPKTSRLEVKVSPHFTVALEGDAAETLQGVNTNLRLANRLMKSISRFFGSD